MSSAALVRPRAASWVTRTTVCGCVPAALGAFDFGLLALAGPRVASAVGATGEAYPWLFSASSFAYGAAVVPAAAVIARLGPPRVLALGLAVSAAGTAALACASALALALVARVLFGLGGALAATAALSLLAGVEDEDARRGAFAALGGAVGAGFATGALLASVPSWRLVLLAVATTCVLTACAALRRRGARGSSPPFADPSPGEVGAHAPPDRAVVRAGDSPRPGVDALPGAVVLAAAIALAAVALSRDGTPAVAVGVALAAGLAIAGLRRARPWLPSRRAGLAGVCLAGAAITASGVSATILTGTALAAEDRAGALLGVFGLAVVPGAWLARIVAHRSGHAIATAAGLALQALGLFALALVLSRSAGPAAIAAAVALFGLGHVAANGGAAGAVTALAGPAAPGVAALLVAAQFVGGGAGPVLTADLPAATGVAVAAVIALGGAVVIHRAARAIDYG